MSHAKPAPATGESPNVWIAEDPTLPGTAFAMALADDQFRADIPEILADWLHTFGVKGRLINREDGRRMLSAWDQSKSRLRALNVAPPAASGPALTPPA